MGSQGNEQIGKNIMEENVNNPTAQGKEKNNKFLHKSILHCHHLK